MHLHARIFVAGHRGTVGSAIVRNLQAKGYGDIVVRTHQELDLLDQTAVYAFLQKEKPDYLFLAAGKVGGIQANNTYRADFIYQNLMIEANIVHAAHQAGMQRLLFLGSSCIYPRDCLQPIKEEYLLTGPLEATNEPYAIAKIAGVKLCESYNRQYGRQYVSAMPTNLYGPNDNYDLANSHVLPALLRKAHEAKLRGDKKLEVWGSGKPMREFLHVDDMADASVFLMEREDIKDGLYNVGTGTDVTIRELAETIMAVVGFKGELAFDASKPDGTPRKLLDVSRLNAIGWHSKIGLRQGLEKTYRDYCTGAATIDRNNLNAWSAADPRQLFPPVVKMIPVNEPLLNGNERKYLAECIDSGWISSEGPFVRRLEQGMAAVAGQKHGIAVTNGSAALDVAVAALGIGAGDEVILPTFTIISCAAAIVRAGATPVVMDSDPRTWNMDPLQLEAKITPRTKAIMVVHIYGLPVDMDPVREIAKRHRLKIIEDSAEQIGQVYFSKNADARPVGSFGDIATFSFYPNKHVTTGEGGMVLTSDDELAEKSRSLRNLCFGKKQRFVHEELGWNFRMSNLQAAVGVAQMERLPETLQKKREIGKWYEELFKDLPHLQRLPLRTDYAENIHWVYGIVLSDEVPFDADEAIRRLGAKGIGTRPFFWPMHEQPVFHKMGLFRDVSCPVAERIARRGFYIPSGVALTRDQAGEVAEAVRQLLRES